MQRPGPVGIAHDALGLGRAAWRPRAALVVLLAILVSTELSAAAGVGATVLLLLGSSVVERALARGSAATVQRVVGRDREPEHDRDPAELASLIAPPLKKPEMSPTNSRIP